eukprot:12890965-Prorocentrum_lima.AAC.1
MDRQSRHTESSRAPSPRRSIPELSFPWRCHGRSYRRLHIMLKGSSDLGIVRLSTHGHHRTGGPH